MHVTNVLPAAASQTAAALVEPRAPRADAVTAAARKSVLIAGDLHNLGDLALLLQNVAIARRQGKRALVRRWDALPEAVAAQIGDAGAELIDGRRLFAFLRASVGAEYVIGGGQIVRDGVSLRNQLYLLLGARLARRTGGSVETRGLGVDPVEGGASRMLWRRLLGLADAIRVRDEASQRHARALAGKRPVVRTADMAFFGDMAEFAAAAPVDPGAVVIAPGTNPAGFGTLLQAIAAELPGHPVVIARHDLGAAPALDALGARHAAVTLADDPSLARLLARYRDASLVVTNRLHAALFALLFDRPLLLTDGTGRLEPIRRLFDLPSLPRGHHFGEEKLRSELRRALDVDPQARARARKTLAEQAAANVPGRGNRIVIFNVKYSPNLGDGLIAECLERELRAACPGAEPFSLDLAGRRGFDAVAARHRGKLLHLLERLPGFVRTPLVRSALWNLVRRKLEPQWRRELQTCRAAIVGGGALFADADLNFPMKVNGALRACAAARIPVAVASVGVTDNWSRTGHRLYREGLERADLVFASVRDRNSQARWDRLLASDRILPARLAPDPGLLAADHFPHIGRHEGRPRIGLCLTDPRVLRLHSDQPGFAAATGQWLADLVRTLTAADCQIQLFTNGSPEDVAWRDHVEPLLRGRGRGRVTVAHEMARPGELATYIGSLDCVLAYRLHACIAAYSYGVPSLGFAWDGKVASFFEQTGRAAYMVDPTATSPDQTAELTWRAIAEGVEPERRAALMADARNAIADMARALTRSREDAA